MRKAFYFILCISVVLSSCGNDEPKEEELDNIDVEKNPLGALVKMGEKMAESAEKMEKNMKQNKDAKAIHYEELINFLPNSIDGYSADSEPKGASMDMSGMSYSSAEVTFSNDKNEQVHIALLDYNAALSMYTMATAMWASGLKIDTSEELGQSISFGDNINGWESIQKKSGNASIVLGINDRFLLTIEGDNQKNTSFLKEIAKSIDLDGLSELN